MSYQHNDRLQQHSCWSPIQKPFYSKYATVIRYTTTSYTKQKFLSKFKNTYRSVNRHDRSIGSRIESVYTNNVELIDHILDNYNVIGIESPVNEKHYDYLLLDDREIIFRNTPWYGQYYNKVDVFTTRWNNTEQDIYEIHDTMYELFESSSRWSGKEWRKNRIMNRTINRWSPYYYFNIPCIYTNDEYAMMLFKMRHGSNARINITTIITMESLA